MLADRRTHGVAADIGGDAGDEVGELGMTAQRAFEREAALVEDAGRGAMLGMTQRVEPLHAESRGQIPHRGQGLGRVASAPRIMREHVAGGCLLWRVETEAGAAKERLRLTRFDQERTGRPAMPFRGTEFQEPARVVERAMGRPAEILGDPRIAGIPLEHRARVFRARWPQHQPIRLYNHAGNYPAIASSRVVKTRNPRERARLTSASASGAGPSTRSTASHRPSSRSPTGSSNSSNSASGGAMSLVTSGQNHCPITGMCPARNSDNAAHSISRTFAPTMKTICVSTGCIAGAGTPVALLCMTERCVCTPGWAATAIPSSDEPDETFEVSDLGGGLAGIRRAPDSVRQTPRHFLSPLRSRAWTAGSRATGCQHVSLASVNSDLASYGAASTRSGKGA